jgi:hypothetical protein
VPPLILALEDIVQTTCCTTRPDKPLAVRIDDLIRQVLESRCNSDLTPQFEGTGVETLADWARSSASAPEFHRQIHLPTHQRQAPSALPWQF